MTSDLRILCLNDVYKPERFSMLQTLRGLHKGPGLTKLGAWTIFSLFRITYSMRVLLNLLNEGFNNRMSVFKA